MNLLFTSEEVIELCDDGTLHSKNLNQHYTKYSKWGSFICVGYSKRVHESSLPKLDDKITCVLTTKENTLRNLKNIKRNNHKIINDTLVNYGIDFLVCHVPSNNSYHAISIAQKQKIPYISIVVGCSWDAMWNYDLRGKLLAIPSYLQLKKVVSESPYSIYVTKYFLERRYPTPGKYTYASNVQLPPLNPDILKQRIKKVKDSDSKCLSFATVADVNVRYKGQEYVIEALSILKHKYNLPFHYYLIGGGDQTFLKSVAQKNRIEDSVFFIGALSHEMVINSLDEMDFYIHPSKQEGLPRALIEAMSRGLPSIGTNVAGIPELLSQDFLIKKGSVKSIVDAILRIKRQNVLLREAERNFMVAKDYTIDVINQRRDSFIKHFLIENSLIEKEE